MGVKTNPLTSFSFVFLSSFCYFFSHFPISPMEFDADKLNCHEIAALMSGIPDCIPVKLRDANEYPNWKNQMSSFLKDKGLFGFVDGTFICPSSRQMEQSTGRYLLSEQFKQWIYYDGLVRTCLVKSCSDLESSYSLPDPTLVTSEQYWGSIQSFFPDSPQGFAVEVDPILIGDEEDKFKLEEHSNSVLFDDKVPLNSKLVPVRAANSCVESGGNEVGNILQCTTLSDGPNCLDVLETEETIVEKHKAVPARAVSECKKMLSNLVDNKLINLYDVVDGGDNGESGLSWSAEGHLQVDIKCFETYTKSNKHLARSFKALDGDLEYYCFSCVLNNNIHARYQHDVFKKGNRDALSLYVANLVWLHHESRHGRCERSMKDHIANASSFDVVPQVVQSNPVLMGHWTTLKGQVKTIPGLVQNLKSDVNTVEGTVSHLKSRIDDLESRFVSMTESFLILTACLGTNVD